MNSSDASVFSETTSFPFAVTIEVSLRFNDSDTESPLYLSLMEQAKHEVSLHIKVQFFVPVTG